MDDLRLILLLLGVAVLAAIWAFEVWRRRRNAALRDDPFGAQVDDEYNIDELPPWDEDDFPGDEATTVPRAVAGREPPAVPGRAQVETRARARDLFEEPAADDDDDEPPLTDLPAMRASRDERDPGAERELPAIVPETDAQAPRETSRASPAATSPASSGRPGPATPEPVRPRRPIAAEVDEDDTEVQPEPERMPPATRARAPLQPPPLPPAPTGQAHVDAEPPVEPRPPAAEHAPARPEQVLSLTVMARPGRRFVGHQIRAALESVGMRFGDMDIFHRHGEDEHQPPGPVLFSAVNVLKPGTFDLSSLGDLATPGVALFMQVPGPADPVQTFELMLDTARRLAERLGGEIGDAARQPLSAGRLAGMRAVAAGEDGDDDA